MKKQSTRIGFCVYSLLLLNVFVFIGCVEDENDARRDDAVVLTKSDNGLTREVRPGQEILVEIYGNPSTGYEWEADSFDESILEQIGEEEFEVHSQDDPPMPGDGGTYRFWFKSVAVGQTNLKMINRRPWVDASEDEFAKVFEVTLVVQ